MFSFIKFLKNIMEKVKANKWVYYFILSTVSFAGIIVTMYFLTTLTGTVSSQVYSSTAKNFSTSLDFVLKQKEASFKAVGTSLSNDANLKKAIGEKATEDYLNILKSYNESYEKDSEKISVSFYSSEEQINRYRPSVNIVLSSKAGLFGFETLEEGVYLTLLKPLFDNGNNILGVIEIKEPISVLKQLFLSDGKSIALALDKKVLPLMPIATQRDRFNNIHNLKIDQVNYDGAFVANIMNKKDIDYEKFNESNYSVDKLYYTARIKISDINGNDIGFMFMGELVNRGFTYLSAIDEVVSVVTKVSLGLIISIIMFMF